MHAVLLERNKLVGRKVCRWLLSAGMTAVAIEDPAQLVPALDDSGGVDLICADVFDADLVAEQLRARRAVRGVLWTAEPLKRALRYAAETPNLDHVLARKDFESPPRAWEVLMIARRYVAARGSATARGTNERPPLHAYLDWGASTLELPVRTTADRDYAVVAITEFVARLQVPRRIADMFAELGHELLMNAMYDAPVDAHGRPKYAGDRKAVIELAESERPTVRLGSDGSRLVMQVTDPFGRLERRHVVEGLARGLAGGEIDSSGGGAGLGMMVCHNSSSAMVFDVARDHYTEVTAVFELDMNLRELRTSAKSLHLWSWSA